MRSYGRKRAFLTMFRFVPGNRPQGDTVLLLMCCAIMISANSLCISISLKFQNSLLVTIK